MPEWYSVIGNGLMQDLSQKKSPLERGGREAAGVCLPYNPKLKSRARELRNNSTLSEVLLWNQLKQNKVCGCDFHRQKPIDEYIVDFFCPELMLAIEIDGRSHDGKYKYDKKRQAKIENYGIKFLRFSDEAIKKRLNAVLDKIQWWIEDNTPRPKGHPYQEGI